MENDNLDLFKDQEPLVPPKPKELHSVYSIPLPDVLHAVRNPDRNLHPGYPGDGWRNSLIAQRQDGVDRFYSPAAPNR